MHYTRIYYSPLGEILLACDDIGLIGLWFTGQKYYASTLNSESIQEEHPILTETCRWLDMYFIGIIPDSIPPLHFIGTSFQMDIWKILCEIPYGKTITYGEIATIYAKQHGLSSMSAQAVGGAVSRNPISIIVPCHRVVGSTGNPTGYAGGLDKKIELLSLETIEQK